MTDSIRLIHATRLLLDEPVLGAGTLSGEERRLVEDATITAFHRIVEACVDKHVDILILSGDTFDETSFTSELGHVDRRTGDTVRCWCLDLHHSWNDGLADQLATSGQLADEVTLLGTERDAPIEITEKGRVIAVVNHLTPGTASLDPPSYKLSAVQIGIIPEGDVPPGGLEAWLNSTSGWNYIALGAATSLARFASRMGSPTHPAAPSLCVRDSMEPTGRPS